MKRNKDLLSFLSFKYRIDEYQDSRNEAVKKQCIQLIDNLEIYYEIYDIDNHTNFSQIFKSLYLSNEVTNYKTIADQFYIDVKTLYIYRKKFNKLAFELLCEKGLDRLLDNKYFLKLN
ncbi:hypothetical protein KHQ81_08460 [Mycoplasmatota bacterium]|nr:hypothetical protein KHQ81_08460 [Mycoplasmatota bacterium]